MIHPNNKFERNERKRKKRKAGTERDPEEKTNRLRRRLYKEKFKDQETKDELRAYANS